MRQCLAGGFLDELQLSVVGVLLGGGTRLFPEGEPAGPSLEQVEAVEAPGVVHLRYRVGD